MMKCFEHHRVRSILNSSKAETKDDNAIDEHRERERTRQLLDEQFHSMADEEKRIDEQLNEARDHRRRQFQRVEEQFKEQSNRFIEQLQRFFVRFSLLFVSLRVRSPRSFSF